MLLDMVKSMLAQENLPISYWEDALLTTSHILNQIPSNFVLSTPYELWNNKSLILAICDLGGLWLIFTILLINMEN